MPPTTLEFGFNDRKYFGDFLNSRKLTNLGVEVGVHRAEFASQLMSRWKGRNLTCVDDYRTGYSNDDPVSNRTRLDREEDFQHATRVMGQVAKGRYSFLTIPSEEASTYFEDNSLDFVYIDASHEVTDFYRDLLCWYPKVKPGAILAGHDIVCPGEVDGGWGSNIQQSLFEFCKLTRVQRGVIYLVPGRGPWSWYVIKPTTDNGSD